MGLSSFHSPDFLCGPGLISYDFSLFTPRKWRIHLSHKVRQCLVSITCLAVDKICILWEKQPQTGN